MTVRTGGRIDLTPYALKSEIQVMQHEVPVTGATVSVNAVTTILMIEPAGTLASLTINFPTTPSRGDGHVIIVATTQLLLLLNMDPGANNTFAQNITTLAANGFVSFVYRSNKWYRCA